MESSEITAWVNAALAFVPEGDYCQSRFRERLNSSLRNALGPKPQHRDWTVEQLVLSEIAGLGCQPRCDPALLALDWPSDR